MLIEAEDLKITAVQELNLIDVKVKEKQLNKKQFITKVAEKHGIEQSHASKLFMVIEKVIERELISGIGAVYIAPYMAFFPTTSHAKVKNIVERNKAQKKYELHEYLCKNRSKVVTAILDYKEVEYSEDNKKEYHRNYWRKRMIKEYLDNYIHCFLFPKHITFNKVLELTNKKIVLQPCNVQTKQPLEPPRTLTGNELKKVLKHSIILNDLIL